MTLPFSGVGNCWTTSVAPALVIVSASAARRVSIVGSLIGHVLPFSDSFQSSFQLLQARVLRLARPLHRDVQKPAHGLEGQGLSLWRGPRRAVRAGLGHLVDIYARPVVFDGAGDRVHFEL